MKWIIPSPDLRTYNYSKCENTGKITKLSNNLLDVSKCIAIRKYESVLTLVRDDSFDVYYIEFDFNSSCYCWGFNDIVVRDRIYDNLLTYTLDVTFLVG